MSHNEEADPNLLYWDLDKASRNDCKCDWVGRS